MSLPSSSLCCPLRFLQYSLNLHFCFHSWVPSPLTPQHDPLKPNPSSLVQSPSICSTRRWTKAILLITIDKTLHILASAYTLFPFPVNLPAHWCSKNTFLLDSSLYTLIFHTSLQVVNFSCVIYPSVFLCTDNFDSFYKNSSGVVFFRSFLDCRLGEGPFFYAPVCVCVGACTCAAILPPLIKTWGSNMTTFIIPLILLFWTNLGKCSPLVYKSFDGREHTLITCVFPVSGR